MQAVNAGGKRLPRSSRVVVRQLELFGDPRHLLLPVIQVTAEHLLIETPPLPQREIRILDRHRLQRVWAPVMEGLIEQHELPVEHAHRPSVEDNMMKAAQ